MGIAQSSSTIPSSTLDYYELALWYIVGVMILPIGANTMCPHSRSLKAPIRWWSLAILFFWGISNLVFWKIGLEDFSIWPSLFTNPSGLAVILVLLLVLAWRDGLIIWWYGVESGSGCCVVVLV